MNRFLLPALALVALVAGCAQEAAPPRGVKGGDGTLRLSFGAEPQSLHPNLGPDEGALVVTENIYNRLVSLAVDGNVIPELADGWEESEDGRTYTFHLRAGVRWHDGRPLTADDVRLTLLRVMQESSNRDVAARIADVTAPTRDTIVVRLDKPWAAFLTSFAWFGTSILPAHVYGTGAWADHPANNRPIGTGPFKFKTWEPGRRIVLEKNDDYFGPGPYIDEVEYLFTRTADEGTDMLVQKRADLLIGRPPAHRLAELGRSPALQVITTTSDGRTYLSFNLRRPPFDDVRVRRAVNMAIDRRTIVDESLGGYGAPAMGFYTPTVAWAYNGTARAPAYNREAARRMIAAAVDPGFVATLLCSTLASGPVLAEEIGKQLGAAGLRVRSRCVPPPEYLALLLERRDFDLALMSGSQGPDPDSLMRRFGSTGAVQVMGYANSELDGVLERGAISTDMRVRAVAYFRAQEILAQDLPIVPLVENVRVSVSRAGLRGLPQQDARGLVPDFKFNLVRLPTDR